MCARAKQPNTVIGVVVDGVIAVVARTEVDSMQYYWYELVSASNLSQNFENRSTNSWKYDYLLAKYTQVKGNINGLVS